VGCTPRVGIAKLNIETVASVSGEPLDGANKLILNLPVPIADGAGGLFDAVSLRWIDPCVELKADRCTGSSRLFATYQGTRLADDKIDHPKGW
jgi:hypothetical protein